MFSLDFKNYWFGRFIDIMLGLVSLKNHYFGFSSYLMLNLVFKYY